MEISEPLQAESLLLPYHGYVIRMSQKRIIRQTLQTEPTNIRSKSKSRIRSLDNIHSHIWSCLGTQLESVMIVVSDRSYGGVLESLPISLLGRVDGVNGWISRDLWKFHSEVYGSLRMVIA